MASSRHCDMCKKSSVPMHCIGCDKYFCNKHFTGHRESWFGELEKIVENRNQLQEEINRSIQFNPVMIDIDEWEKTTIEKVKNVAAFARQQTIQLLNTNRTKIGNDFKNLSQELTDLRESGDFIENDLVRLNEQINQFKFDIKQSTQTTDIILRSEQSDRVDWENLIYVDYVQSTIKWEINSKTIAGGHGQGNDLNQLDFPQGIYVDRQQQSIYIADYGNHRIVRWELGGHDEQIAIYGNGKGNRIDQLNGPIDVIVDENNKSLIIADWENKRVVRWSLENSEDKEILIENISCCGLKMNENGDLFVSDSEKDEVRRWRKGEKDEGTIVAGGNGRGDKLDQLNRPAYIFIDRQETVYISDWGNHRVMKWLKDADKGIVVAGGYKCGNSLKQLYHPNGLIVNEVGDVYVADSRNNRIMCWVSGSEEGRVVAVVRNDNGDGLNQFHVLEGLSFDVENNLYVVDRDHSRVQRFSVNKN